MHTPTSQALPAPTTAKTIFGFAKLPPRFNGIVMPFMLSVLMTSIVSLISTLRGIGVVPDLTTIWLSAWAMSWAVAFPTTLLVLPLVKRASAALVRAPQPQAA